MLPTSESTFMLGNHSEKGTPVAYPEFSKKRGGGGGGAKIHNVNLEASNVH